MEAARIARQRSGLPRLGARVRIPSPAPIFLKEIRRLERYFRAVFCSPRSRRESAHMPETADDEVAAVVRATLRAWISRALQSGAFRPVVDALVVPVVVPLGRIDVEAGGIVIAVSWVAVIVGPGRIVSGGRFRIVRRLRVAVARVITLLRAATNGAGQRRQSDDGTDGSHDGLL